MKHELKGLMKMKRMMLTALAALVGSVASAGENLLPDSFVNALCQRRNTGVSYLKAEGGMPEGILVTTDKALDPIYKIETSAAVPCAVKKGDLLVLTAAVRGVSPSGKVAVLAKFQDNTYTGALRDNLTASSQDWTWCRITGTASKDYAADSMRLHIYPWTGAQQVEIRGWKLENLGPVKKDKLPPLATAPTWPAGALKSPEPPPPPKPVELAPLTAEQRAKKRYCILKFDDVGNNKGRVHPKFDKVAKFLDERKLHGSFGVIVKSIENQPNADYIAWLKKNAIENGGNFEFWDHGWDHAMFFNCKEDDDCDRTVKFHGEHVAGLAHQRLHLNKALDTFTKHTGLVMHTLGTAGNAGDDNTRKVLAERPEVKVWIFGKGKSTPDLEVLGRWLNLEHAVGKVDYADFVKNYQRNRMKDYIVLQGHCAMWSDQHYADFTKIIDLLQKEGWIFVTPYEYYRIKRGEVGDPAPGVAPKQAVPPAAASGAEGGPAYSSGPTVLKAGADWLPLKASPEVVPGSALDFSGFRETGKPAGKYGRVVRKGAHFEFEKRPGKPVRFYGVNLCFGANYPEYDEAKALAANLARIGYNAVRIHHHDGALVKNNPNSTDLDSAQLKRLDGLIAACSAEGLYITTDLFVSRPVSWKAMGIDKPGVPSKDIYKVLVPIHPGARKNFLNYSRKFLTHINAYTGKRYADEPALCLLALVNEGNEMNWGGKLLQPLEIYQTEWKKWLAKKQAVDPSYAKVPDTIPENAWGWGEHTPAFTQFLADVETAFCQEMKTFLRDEIKTHVPVTNLSSWWNPVVFQRCRAETLDVVDDHFYIDHPSFLEKPWNLPSKCKNENPLKGEAMGMTDVICERLLDRPFTITEYNYSGPGRFRGVGGIVTGAAGALQDWDGLWRFAWAHNIDSIRKPGSQPMGYFNMADDPLSLAAERASICLFLRRDLPVLDKTCEIQLPADQLRKIDPKQTMSKMSGKWLGWYFKTGTKVAEVFEKSGRDLDFETAYRGKTAELEKKLFPKGKRPHVAGNGHVAIKPEDGTFVLKTDRTCGGFAEKGGVKAGPFAAVTDTPATVWASSLDGKVLEQSAHILVTHLTDLQNSDIRYRDPERTVLEAWGHLPYLMRKGKADVSLKAAPGKWTVKRLDATGRVMGTVPSTYADGELRFSARTDHDPSNATYLYELERP